MRRIDESLEMHLQLQLQLQPQIVWISTCTRDAIIAVIAAWPLSALESVHLTVCRASDSCRKHRLQGVLDKA